MKICFVVNEVETERAGTTVHIMYEAWKRKHEVYLMGVGNFSFTQNEALSIISTCLPKGLKPETPEEYPELLQARSQRS